MSENTRTPPAAGAEPVAWLYSKIGCKPYVTANRRPQFVDTGSTETELFTRDQLQAYGDARAREALERAAGVIDQCNRDGPYLAIGAATAIRALKENPNG